MQRIRHLLLGQQIHLQIDVCPLVCNVSHALLVHQYKYRQRQGFDAYEKREQVKRIRVEWNNRILSQIENDPNTNDNNLNDQEPKRAGKSRNRVAESLGGGATAMCGFFQLADRSYVSADRVGH